jgi:hypothetical protein
MVKDYKKFFKENNENSLKTFQRLRKVTTKAL